MEHTKVMGRRVVAWFVDGILLGAVNIGVFFAMAEKDTDIARKLIDGEYQPNDTSYGNITIGDHEWAIVGGRFLLYVAIVLVIFALYDWVLQGLKGFTIGKLAVGIRLVRADGTPPGIGRAIARWFLWIADSFPYVIPNLVGFIVAMTNEGRQRIGDKVAGTWVVEASAAGRPVTGGAAPVAPVEPTLPGVPQ